MTEKASRAIDKRMATMNLALSNSFIFSIYLNEQFFFIEYQTTAESQMITHNNQYIANFLIYDLSDRELFTKQAGTLAPISTTKTERREIIVLE